MRSGRGEVVSRAYHRALVESPIDAALAEALVRRMIAFDGEYGADSPLLVEALQRMLELSPGARWAIDRVKLVLGSQARWDELFGIYDRAIAVAPDDGARAALLDEAAFAAKDLAARPERAIVYFESIHALRPEDPTVDASLERLYEKQGHTSALIQLLDGRLARRTGFHRLELLRKMASLWADLGNAEEAIAIVDRMLSDGAPVADTTDLLERLATDVAASKAAGQAAGEPTPEPHSSIGAQKRAIALLRAHYEAVGQIDDVIRMSERELALAADTEGRTRCIRDLVALRLAAAERTKQQSVFAQVIPRVEADVVGDALLAKIAFEAVLQRALIAWKQPASTARDDAADGAWRVIHILGKLLVDHGKGEAALNLFTRCSRLPFERARRRELVREAALSARDRLADTVRAIRTFGELFEEDGGDDVAARSLQRFATLLEESGELPRLAALWEAQSLVHEKAGRATDERACWERAARLWERQDEAEKAVAAYGRAGALGLAGGVRGAREDPLGARRVGRGRRSPRVAGGTLPRRGARAPGAAARRGLRGAGRPRPGANASRERDRRRGRDRARGAGPRSTDHPLPRRRGMAAAGAPARDPSATSGAPRAAARVPARSIGPSVAQARRARGGRWNTPTFSPQVCCRRRSNVGAIEGREAGHPVHREGAQHGAVTVAQLGHLKSGEVGDQIFAPSNTIPGAVADREAARPVPSVARNSVTVPPPALIDMLAPSKAIS